jgi:hypothetical protein
LKNSFQIIIFLLSINVFSQGDFKVITEDFDNDGALEELIVNSYLGVIENAILTYDQGEKTCTLNIEPQKRHPSLINTVPLCDDLLKPQYKKIAQFVDSVIFKIPASKTIDPTLGWLLDVYASKKEVKNNTYFVSHAKFNPKIRKSYYDDPSSHRLLAKGKLIKKINRFHGKTDTTFKSWITFDAAKLNEARQITRFNLHPEWPELVDSVGPVKIFKTGHSVFMETDTAHQIFFVSDGLLFKNLQKLKWESIQQLGRYKNYFLILTHPYPGVENKLFLIDSKKGFILEFNNEVLMDRENFYDNIESFEVMEDELFLFLRESPEFDDDIKEYNIPFVLIMQSVKKIIDNPKK